MIVALMRALKTGVLDDLLGAAAQTAASRNIPMRQVMAEAEESLIRMARANPNVAKRAQDINLTGLIRGHTEGSTIPGKSSKIQGNAIRGKSAKGVQAQPTFEVASRDQRVADVEARIKRAVPKEARDLYVEDGSTPAEVADRIVDLDDAGALGAGATRGRIRANMYDPPPANSTRAELAEALEAELLDDPTTSLLNEPAQRPIGLIPGTRMELQPVAPDHDRLQDLAEVASAQRKTPARNSPFWGGSAEARASMKVRSVEPLGRDGGDTLEFDPSQEYPRYAETLSPTLSRALTRGGGSGRGGGGAYLAEFDDGRGGSLWSTAQKVVKPRKRERGERGIMAGDIDEDVYYAIPGNDEAIHLTKDDAIQWAAGNVEANRGLGASDVARVAYDPDIPLTLNQRRMRQREIGLAEADAQGSLTADLVSERTAWRQPTPDQMAESPIRRKILGGEEESSGLGRFGGGAPPPPRPNPNPTASGMGGGVVRSPMPEEGTTSPWTPPSGRTVPSSPQTPVSPEELATMLDAQDPSRRPMRGSAMLPPTVPRNPSGRYDAEGNLLPNTWTPRPSPPQESAPMSMMDELDAMRPRSTGMVPRGVSPTQARYWDERFGPERQVPWIQSLLGLGGLALLPAGAYAMAEAGGEDPWL